MGSSKTVGLPRDAEGREIPLNTKVLYDADGNELRVKCVEFDPFDENWRFILKADSSIWFDARYPRYAHLEKPTPPDSWDKLLEDLDHASKGDDIECSYLVFADIAARIRKLRGEGE